MEKQEELNYKQGYYFLFNRMTDLIEYIQFLQRKAEDICAKEVPPVQIQLDTKAMLYGLIKNIEDGI